jgi:hypothetical protein
MSESLDEANPAQENVRILLGNRIERSVELRDGFFQIAFLLIPRPEIDWKLCFANVWMQHFARQTQRNASVDRDMLLCECLLTELREFFQTLKLAVETTNNVELERKNQERIKVKLEEERQASIQKEIDLLQSQLKNL